MEVGEIIRRERIAKGLSIRGLAKKAGVAPATIFNTETGRHEPNQSTMMLIARALNIKSSDILLESIASIVQEADKKKGAGNKYG